MASTSWSACQWKSKDDDCDNQGGRSWQPFGEGKKLSSGAYLLFLRAFAQLLPPWWQRWRWSDDGDDDAGGDCSGDLDGDAYDNPSLSIVIVLDIDWWCWDK